MKLSELFDLLQRRRSSDSIKNQVLEDPVETLDEDLNTRDIRNLLDIYSADAGKNSALYIIVNSSKCYEKLHINHILLAFDSHTARHTAINSCSQAKKNFEY